MQESVHRAVFTNAQFKSLLKEFPEHKAWLESVVQHFGSKAIIFVDDITIHETRKKTGDELCDRLFRQAYANVHFLREVNFQSTYLQLRETLNLPKSKIHDILEIGKGTGLFNALINMYDYEVKTLDVDTSWQPDLKGDILDIPSDDKSFDLVCAFEVLQHLPSGKISRGMEEMARVARSYVYISLPCQTNSVHFRLAARFRQSILSRFSFDFRFFRAFPSINLLDRDEAAFLKRPDKHHPHYWEVGTMSFPKKRIISMLNDAGLRVRKDFHNSYHPYHWFILCRTK